MDNHREVQLLVDLLGNPYSGKAFCPRCFVWDFPNRGSSGLQCNQCDGRAFLPQDAEWYLKEVEIVDENVNTRPDNQAEMERESAKQQLLKLLRAERKELQKEVQECDVEMELLRERYYTVRSQRWQAFIRDQALALLLNPSTQQQRNLEDAQKKADQREELD